jgi:uncharacterized LabA/DUF88 family protein
MGTNSREPIWSADLARFRVYLKDKYHVEKAYYYLGHVQEGSTFEDLYDEIQAAGFILKFREHNSAMSGKKKGNVDSDIIFSIMKRLYQKEEFDKIVLVSGDGDYKMLVDFLIEENRLEKILFPKRKYASSLYKAIGATHYSDLSQPGLREKIAKKEKGSLGN